MTFVKQAYGGLRLLTRFLKTPKGILLAVFLLFLALATPKLGAGHVLPNLLVAISAAAVLDIAIERFQHRRWRFPDGAILSGLIVAFVLRPEESWIVPAIASVVAILSRQLLRTRWSNIFNPAALALVVSAVALKSGESWWGALPDLGIVGLVAIIFTGVFVADRLNKLPLLLVFLVSYFSLFTAASFLGQPSLTAEMFRAPDLQAVLFFAFFMLDDPPTCPIRHQDQAVFGMMVAGIAYLIFMVNGAVYSLPAALLVGNAWESGRRFLFQRGHGSQASAAHASPPYFKGSPTAPARDGDVEWIRLRRTR